MWWVEPVLCTVSRGKEGDSWLGVCLPLDQMVPLHAGNSAQTEADIYDKWGLARKDGHISIG